jgi:hypothetical protein
MKNDHSNSLKAGKAGLKSEVIVKLHLLRQTGPG